MIREKGDRRSLGTLIPRLARKFPATRNTLTFVEISNNVSSTAPHRSGGGDDERRIHQAKGQGEVREGGAAGDGRRRVLLQERAVARRVRSDHVEPLRRRRDRGAAGRGRGRLAPPPLHLGVPEPGLVPG